jgi:hypothetical protein
MDVRQPGERSMSVAEDGPNLEALPARLRDLFLTPSAEWKKIEREPATVRALYVNLIAPLSAIPVVAGLVGSIAFGDVRNGVASPVSAVGSAIGQYALTLAIVYAMGMVTAFLAETFGGRRDQLQALKLIAYSSTPAWLASAFGVFPWGWLLSLFGVYSVFLLYRGLPRLMQNDDERTMAYAATIVVVALVVSILVFALGTCVIGFG